MKFGTLTNDVAIDLGTDNTRIYYKGNITDEASVIAYDADSGKIIALGKEAGEMMGRNPETVIVAKPLSNGVITDYDHACEMIRGFLAKVTGTNVIKPKVMVTVPCGATDVEKRAVCDAVKASDIKDVYVMEAPIAGAIGANCDVSLARGMMLVDIGGGSCDIAVISLGQVVTGKSLKLGGDEFTAAIIEYVKNKYDLLIGEHTAAKVKEEIGCAFQREKDISVEVGGFNTKTRSVQKIRISSEETREAISELIQKIADEIKAALDDTPTELLGDIMEDGILMVGGGAQLYGLQKRLRIDLGVKMFLAEDAQMCVARGAGATVENMDKMDDGTYLFYKG
ncbi:MAG: rod shape-determining protein [Firmicutes bacterium]|nr:rod shape-determining protein [Bacillota bacterium]